MTSTTVRAKTLVTGHGHGSEALTGCATSAVSPDAANSSHHPAIGRYRHTSTGSALAAPSVADAPRPRR
jgi:hypothetical protein